MKLNKEKMNNKACVLKCVSDLPLRSSNFDFCDLEGQLDNYPSHQHRFISNDIQL